MALSAVRRGRIFLCGLPMPSPNRCPQSTTWRPLTGAGSRRSGLGPTCDAKLHPAPPDIRTRRHEVEQDTLPGI